MKTIIAEELSNKTLDTECDRAETKRDKTGEAFGSGDQLLDYMKKCEVIIQPLCKKSDTKKQSLVTGSKRINLNYYLKCPTPELTVGVGRHSDVSTFTILHQDNVGELYVRDLDGESWIHVHGAIVINVGDVLQIMSNGRYKSIEHRVAANGTHDRISIPLFINPNPSNMIGPLKEPWLMVATDDLLITMSYLQLWSMAVDDDLQTRDNVRQQLPVSDK
ncbi:Feruloyl CoA ortho-hydroxylase F6H1-3-like protein [Drosera capensis]